MHVVFSLQKTMVDRRVCFVVLRTALSRSVSRAICSAHVAGGLVFPWQALRRWNPHSFPARRLAKKTRGRWMRTIPWSSETSSSTCSTPLHPRSWPASSSWGAGSRSILWNTGLNTDRSKPWRVWWMYHCWSTKALSRFSTPSSILLRRRKKWRSVWPSSSGQRSTGPG